MNPHTTVHERAGEQSLRFRREFDAPAALVFRAHVEPALFCQWIGPAGTRCEVEELRAVTGGAFRYHVVGGSTFSFFGSYHEVVAGERISHTWEFVGDPGRPTFETLRFTDLAGGRCRLDGVSLYTSPEQCTEMLEFDLTGEGMDENFVRLDQVLSSLAR